MTTVLLISSHTHTRWGRFHWSLNIQINGHNVMWFSQTAHAKLLATFFCNWIRYLFKFMHCAFISLCIRDWKIWYLIQHGMKLRKRKNTLLIEFLKKSYQRQLAMNISLKQCWSIFIQGLHADLGEKMSTARIWPVSSMSSSQKLHMHLEMPKINNSGLWRTCRVVNFEGP